MPASLKRDCGTIEGTKSFLLFYAGPNFALLRGPSTIVCRAEFRSIEGAFINREVTLPRMRARLLAFLLAGWLAGWLACMLSGPLACLLACLPACLQAARPEKIQKKRKNKQQLPPGKAPGWQVPEFLDLRFSVRGWKCDISWKTNTCQLVSGVHSSDSQAWQV